jgi:CRP/FNR family transcriptional regulator, dissimilatory nitrate respiration regulator
MNVDPTRLKNFSLFRDLPDGILERIATFSRSKEFPKNTLIFSSGDPANAFYLVETGKIKVYRDTPDGREQVLHIVQDGQSYAEVAVLSMNIFPASAFSLTPCKTIQVPRDGFVNLIETDAVAAKAMIAGQAKWIRLLVDQATTLSLADVSVRLARYIVTYAQKRGLSMTDGAQIELDVKKATIANLIGTVPETLSRNLAKLEDEELIQREGKKIVILDVQGLIELAFPGEGWG